MMAEHFMGVTEAALELGIAPGTVKTHITRGRFPAPDAFIGDTRGWKPETIKEFKKSREKPRT